MIIDRPTDRQMSQLWGLWREAFGDSGEFLDAFFTTAYSPDRCRCVTEDGKIAAAVYWLDCEVQGKKLAYLYALATAIAYRGRGIAHQLMKEVHTLLTQQGYEGIVLVPGTEALRAFYETLGYYSCTKIKEFVCTGAAEEVQLRRVTAEEYAKERRDLFSLLEPNGVIQEGENLAFLQTQAELYIGQNFLLAARSEGDTLFGIELLGDPQTAPGILRTLGYARGTFRTRGNETDFAMYRSLSENSLPAPSYFGLAFD